MKSFVYRKIRLVSLQNQVPNSSIKPLTTEVCTVTTTSVTTVTGR